MGCLETTATGSQGLSETIVVKKKEEGDTALRPDLLVLVVPSGGEPAQIITAGNFSEEIMAAGS